MQNTSLSILSSSDCFIYRFTMRSGHRLAAHSVQETGATARKRLNEALPLEGDAGTLAEVVLAGIPCHGKGLG